MVKFNNLSLFLFLIILYYSYLYFLLFLCLTYNRHGQYIKKYSFKLNSIENNETYDEITRFALYPAYSKHDDARAVLP